MNMLQKGRSDTRVLVAVIGAIGLVVVALIQSGWTGFKFGEPRAHSLLKNTSGEIGRVEAISGCGKSPWIDILDDGSVQIGLSGTTTGLRPQSATLYVQRREQPDADFTRLQPLEIAVGQSKVLTLPDGRRVDVKIESVSSDNCTANYSLTLQS